MSQSLGNAGKEVEVLGWWIPRFARWKRYHGVDLPNAACAPSENNQNILSTQKSLDSSHIKRQSCWFGLWSCLISVQIQSNSKLQLPWYHIWGQHAVWRNTGAVPRKDNPVMGQRRRGSCLDQNGELDAIVMHRYVFMQWVRRYVPSWAPSLI